MNIDEKDIITLIREYNDNHHRTPTIFSFAKEYGLHASSIIRKFGSWNDLIKLSGLKINKSSKRTDDQLLMWLKTHPNVKYYEIPFGIRNSLEDRFSTIRKARTLAGLPINDFRVSPKRSSKRNYKSTGRPIEYSREQIIEGLRNLALKLKRPPRMKDIKKQNCGFPISALLSRFSTFNEALQAASLPPIYTYHEFNKLTKELLTLLMNIKIVLNDIPLFFNLEIENLKPIFVYKDRWEDVILKRSDIQSNLNIFQQYKKKCNKIIIWYLVDDSLYENEDFEIKSIMDIRNDLGAILSKKIYNLRIRYDEINRTYVNYNLLMENDSVR